MLKNSTYTSIDRYKKAIWKNVVVSTADIQPHTIAEPPLLESTFWKYLRRSVIPDHLVLLESVSNPHLGSSVNKTEA